MKKKTKEYILIGLDKAIVRRLKKEENQSRLINLLLKHWYKL